MLRQRITIAIVALIFNAAVGQSQSTLPVTINSDGPRVAYEFSAEDEALLEEIQRGCFLYLWNEVGRPAALVKDRKEVEISSVAAVGFQLSSLPIGVERGWITRQAAEERAVTILRSLIERSDNKKFGVYLHFVNRHTAGHDPNAPEVQFSTIDHALLACGCIPAGVYFGGEVAQLVDQLVEDTNWRAYAVADEGLISFGWRPDDPADIDGQGDFRPWKWWIASAEEQLVYFLAVGAPNPEFAVPPRRYYQLDRTVRQYDSMPPHVVSWNGSLFTYFFSHCWIDYRRFAADDPSLFDIAGPCVDWFENSRRAILTHRQRCIEAAPRFKTLAADRWGLAPCTGLNERGQPSYLVPELRPSHADHDRYCSGTVAPYAAGTSIMFTPQESMDALRAFRHLGDLDDQLVAWRDPADGGYGLVDSFNLDQQYASEDHVGIDVGPMLLGIENARSGLIWRLFHEHEVAKNAVQRLKMKQVGSLRVMTFNIRYGTAGDGENSWPSRRDLVVDVIRRNRPAIVGVQEALHFQLEEIEKAISSFSHVGVGRDDGRQAGEYSAILYDRDRLEVLDQGTFWFSDTPEVAGSITWDAELPRICSWMRCQDLRTQRPFYVYNVHWDHQSQTSREKSAQLLLAIIRSRQFEDDPVIVTGDFNAGEDNPAFVQLTDEDNSPLSDTFRMLHADEQTVGTFNGFHGTADGPKIDAVLVSPHWRLTAAEIDRFERAGQYPSDHFPVTATLVLP